MGMLMLIDPIFKLPASLYKTFVIEQRHGFNKQTLPLFFKDLLLQLLLTAAIGAPVVAAAIEVIIWGGEHFYAYLFLLVLVIQLVLVLLYPTVIAPLFNKFEPLQDGELRVKIEELAESQS